MIFLFIVSQNHIDDRIYSCKRHFDSFLFWFIRSIVITHVFTKKNVLKHYIMRMIHLRSILSQITYLANFK